MKRLVLSMLLSSNVALADHICTNSPNEVYVGNTPAGQGQASMPVCRWVQSGETPSTNRGSTPSPIIIERWHVVDDRYTSFALDGEARGPYGFVFGHESQQAADAAAIEQCEERGGSNCKVVTQGKNSCSSFAWGGGRFSVQGGGTAREAESNSVSVCTETAGVRCEVIQSGCSEPVRRIVYEKPDDFVEDIGRSQ